MQNKMTETPSVLGSMRNLEIGQKVSFPIAKMLNVRSNAGNINSIRGYKSLTTQTDRLAGTITVTRIS